MPLIVQKLRRTVIVSDLNIYNKYRYCSPDDGASSSSACLPSLVVHCSPRMAGWDHRRRLRRRQRKERRQSKRATKKGPRLLLSGYIGTSFAYPLGHRFGVVLWMRRRRRRRRGYISAYDKLQFNLGFTSSSSRPNSNRFGETKNN